MSTSLRTARRTRVPLITVWLLATGAVLPVLGGCASGTAPAPGRVAPPPEPTVVPATAADLSPALHWMRNSAEYRAILIQTYTAASDRIEELAAGREPFTWAVAIDADETILDNSQYQKEREAQGEGFSRESWAEWVHREAAPTLPGAMAFLETVRGLGGHIAVVTNRDEPLCGSTEDNLTAQGVPFDVVLCRPETGDRTKEARWRAVEQGAASQRLPPLEILLWVGDNIGDFPGATQDLRHASAVHFEKFGDGWFILPNPAYGSWEANPMD